MRGARREVLGWSAGSTAAGGERLTVTAPMVLSVEGRERLRRADLDGLLRGRQAADRAWCPPAGAVARRPTESRPVRTGPTGRAPRAAASGR